MCGSFRSAVNVARSEEQRRSHRAESVEECDDACPVTKLEGMPDTIIQRLDSRFDVRLCVK